jgi:hypothetical protein
MSYEYSPHPRTVEHLVDRTARPPKTTDERTGLNGKIGLIITTVVGTMWCAYLFTLLALVSLPDAIRSGQSLVIVAWIAQTFLQLVLLPIIIVGQNIQARTADRRGEQTYRDAEAVLHEAQQIQMHLMQQDEQLRVLVQSVGRA